jgi:hypothetical protein
VSEVSVVVAALERRLELTNDDEEKQRIEDTLAEMRGMSLSGSGHAREGADETS